MTEPVDRTIHCQLCDSPAEVTDYKIEDMIVTLELGCSWCGHAFQLEGFVDMDSLKET